MATRSKGREKASERRATALRINDRDNVAIVVASDGLKAGSALDDGTVLIQSVPQGHKVALAGLGKGAPIIRYGEVIGRAREAIRRGGRIDESLVELPEAPALKDLPLDGRQAAELPALSGYTFDGYRNDDGTVGTKNLLGIMTSVQCVAGVAGLLARRIREEILPRYPNVDGVAAIRHGYGCGVAIDAPDTDIPVRTLQNIARNPNFGGETMILGLGCEKLKPERFVAGEECGTALPEDCVLQLQDERFHGFGQMLSTMMEMAEDRLSRLNRRSRETCPASDLVVGLQCGGSDVLSGITANPAVGYAADLIVRAGGTVIFSEVTEVRDAIHLLVPRAADESTARALVREMAWYDRYLESRGADRSANTTPGNKEGGLANIVEKALGSFLKSGTTPIVDVLAPGERVRRKGLAFAATPASDFVCGTLQVAAGMNVQVFTTGRGTPYGLPMVPVIKVSTNKSLSERWHDLIDIDAGRIATGESTIAEIGWELFRFILDVASGKKQVAADRLGLGNDLCLFAPGPVT